MDKHRKNFAINHHHLYQELSQTSFSNSALKSRTIKKMEKFLPQSPQRKEVIKSLTSKFNIEVQLGQKVGKQKIVLREQENQ